MIVPVPDVGATLRACGLPPGGIGTAPGMPAHVTLLYPFAPAERLDDATLAELRRIVAATWAFPFALTHVARFPGVVYLAPEPYEPFASLTRAIITRWPQYAPYGGAFDEIVPHLTIVDGREPPWLAPAVGAALPVFTRASDVLLMIEQMDGTWATHSRFAFAGPLRDAWPEAGQRA